MSQDTLSALVEVRNRMLTDQSAEARVGAAEQLGSLFSAGAMAAPEHEIALAIFKKLARDVADQVRQALAVQIASSPLIPPELARQIADDIETVAIPFIGASPALPEDDLLAIIASGSAAKQRAIATRESVSEMVSEALVATDDAEVVMAVLRNPGAEVSEPSYHLIMDRFAADNMVQSLMVDRPWLPLGVTERLIEVVSDALRARLAEKHALSPELADALADLARERALLAEAAALPSEFDVETLLARLDSKGRLTPTLLMRAAIQGDIRFFEVGVAVLAMVPPKNAARLIADRGPAGFKALYDKARMPEDYFKAFRAALDAQADLGLDAGQSPSREQVHKVLERVLRAHGGGGSVDLERFLGEMLQETLVLV